MSGGSESRPRGSGRPLEAWRRWVAADRPVDPHLVFAALTEFRWHVFDGPADWLPFLIETREGAPGLMAAARSRWPRGDLPVRIAPVYFEALHDGGRPSRFLTAMVRRDRVRAVLDLAPVVRAQLGLARASAPPAPRRGAVAMAAEPLTTPDGPARTAGPRRHQGPVIAIMDDACPFDHPAMRTPAGHRLLALWQQDPRSVHAPPPGFHHGRLIERGADGWMPDLGPHPSLRERARHAALPHHGVASWQLAAGAVDAGQQAHPGPDARDAAARAELLAVQWPDSLLADTSCASLGVHALDGLRFVHRFIRRRSAGRDIVVSLGYGTQSGPHDGQAPLDAAIAEIAAADRHLHIVVAAGNSHRLACHARTRLTPGHRPPLELFVAPQGSAWVSVEIGFPDAPPDAPLSLTLRAPTGETLTVPRGDLGGLRSRGWGEPVAWLVFPRRSASGAGGAMALLVVLTSRSPDGGAAAPCGVWRIEATGPDGQWVDAWVERTDRPDQPVRRQSAWFVGPAATHSSKAHRTVGPPASSPGVRSVGARRMSDGQLAPYSSRDHARGWPETTDWGDAGTALPGLRTPGAQAQQIVRLNGTSAAAPRVARRLANALALAADPAPPTNSDPPSRTGDHQR